jgi:MFS family permease
MSNNLPIAEPMENLPSPTTSLRAAYVVILSGVVAALQIGKLPPALPELSLALGLSLMQAGFLLSLIQLAGMTLALAVGLLADGFGLKRSLLAGLFILGLASGMGSWATSAEGLMFWRAVEGFGFLWVALPAPGLIRQQVKVYELRQLLGYWGGYMPAGTALTLLLGPLWIPAWGWRTWWLLFALLSWLMVWVVWRVVPPDRVLQTSSAPSQHSMRRRLVETLSAPGPWLVTLCFGLYSGQWLALVGFLPSIYTQAGLSGGTLGALTALAAAVNIIGNVMSGKLLQKGVHPSLLLAVGFITMGLGAYLAFALLTDSMPLLRYVGVLLFSSFGGLVPGTLFTLAVRLAPQERNVSTTVGWMQQGSAAGQFAGPPLVAALATWVGGWQWTWLFMACCCALGCLLSVIIARTLKHLERAA